MIAVLDKLLTTWKRHALWWVLGTAALFVLLPAIDLWFAALFYTPGEGFLLQGGDFQRFIRKGLPPIVIGSALYVLILWAAGLVFRQRFFGIDNRIAGYLVSSLALGPGFLVNVILKSFWGRARPSQVEAFGGDALFTPAILMADQCAKNCSFVSGHAAMAFWVVAYAFLLPRAYRTPGIAAALAFGFLVGVGRMAQGGHFLSDIIFAGIVTTATTWGLYRAWIR